MFALHKTLRPSGLISCAVEAKFTAANEVDLIVSQGAVLSVYRLDRRVRILSTLSFSILV